MGGVNTVVAVPTPSTSTASTGTVRTPPSANPAMVANSRADAASAATITGRRRTRSTSTPASIPSSSAGSHCAARTSPRAVWSASRVRISSSCSARPEANVPSIETPSASQSRTNPG